MIDAEREQELRRAVHRRLVSSDAVEALVDAAPAELTARIAALVAIEEPLLPVAARARVVTAVHHDVVGLGALEPLLADPTVDEIMVNGADRCYVERAGRVEPVPFRLTDDGIVRLVERILAPLGLRLDRASPMVEARLADGSRLHAVIPPLAIDGPCVTIRRFGARLVEPTDFGLDADGAELLRSLTRSGANLVIAGGTGAGKTTLLNALARSLPAEQRIVTIEETAELRIGRPHVVRLEARPANAEGVGAVGVRELVRAALRMRPDRLIVGEVRGGEALDLLQALNTGHRGCLSTVHANTPVDALRRLATLALLGGVGVPHDAVREQLTAAVDAVVQVERTADGARRVAAVVEVDDVPGRLSVTPLADRVGGVLRPCRSARRVRVAVP